MELRQKPTFLHTTEGQRQPSLPRFASPVTLWEQTVVLQGELLAAPCLLLIPSAPTHCLSAFFPFPATAESSGPQGCEAEPALKLGQPGSPSKQVFFHHGALAPSLLRGAQTQVMGKREHRKASKPLITAIIN